MRVRCDPDGVKKANKILSMGGVVIFPTDTVYGIGCNPFDGDAVKKIYKIKNRDYSKPLPVLTHSKHDAKNIADFDESLERLADRMWPGPLTIILKVKEKRLKETLNIEERIAIRVPNHKCTLELLRQSRYIVGTSANISGTRSITDPTECEKMNGYDLLLDGGRIASTGESTVIELVNGQIKVHRSGQIKEEELVSML